MMRAKLQVIEVNKPYDGAEEVRLIPVSNKPFDADGNSEDNSFARWTPSGEVRLVIQNPDLLGKFTVGQKFYADFTEATE